MKKYAQINITNGEVIGVINVQSEYAYPEHSNNGVLYKELAADVNDSTFAETNIWRNNQWSTRDARPSNYHVWQDFAWTFDSASFWTGIRYKRAMLLEECDWTQMPDVGLPDSTITAWRNYRQLLRDVPSTYSSATSESDITWPTKPSSQAT